MQTEEPTDKERDDAFCAGYKSEKCGDNPYKEIGHEAILGRIFVDGWATRIKLERLGRINAGR